MAQSGRGLVELLTARGVPEKGARVYLAACREGPQTASELARLTALNRVEAYRFIRQLESGGLLRATRGRPMRFAAVPPGEILERWIRGTADELRDLEANKERILRAWQESLTSVEELDTRKFTVVEGLGTLARFLKKRLGIAEREVLIAASGAQLSLLIDSGVDRALREAKERGVRLRLVTEITRFNLPEAKHLSQFAEMRHSPVPVTSRIVVVDRRGTLAFVSGEEGLGRSAEEQVALWASTPMFVGLARDYHHRLWTPAVPVAQRIVELEAASEETTLTLAEDDGASLERLQEISAIGMRATGIRELRLSLADVIDMLARQLGRQIASDLDGTTPEEIAAELRAYYAKRALGDLTVAKDRPLVLRVTGCFACTTTSPEIGRALCARALQTVFETRLGRRWLVSKPDPRRHARRGCVFGVTPA